MTAASQTDSIASGASTMRRPRSPRHIPRWLAGPTFTIAAQLAVGRAPRPSVASPWHGLPQRRATAWSGSEIVSRRRSVSSRSLCATSSAMNGGGLRGAPVYGRSEPLLTDPGGFSQQVGEPPKQVEMRRRHRSRATQSRCDRTARSATRPSTCARSKTAADVLSDPA